MIIVSGLARVRADRLDAAGTLARQMEEAARQEPGCLHYGIYVSATDPNSFLVYSEWKSEAALQAHFLTPHMREFQLTLPDILDGPASVDFYRRYDVSSAETL